VLDVFVAGPTDVEAERIVVGKAIDEVNRLVGRKLGRRLQAITWTDLTPSFGSDAQDLINKQVGDRYDIFLGILWGRFGTSTPRAGSGTEEEFQRAYKRLELEPSSIRLLMYFNDAGPTNLSQIDPQQLMEVRRFRADVEKVGLVAPYQSLEEFGFLVRKHLSDLLQEWGEDWGEMEASPSPDWQGPQPQGLTDSLADTSKATVTNDDAGFLDLLSDFNEQSDVLIELAEKVSSHLTVLTESLASRTAEIEAITASPGPAAQQRLREAIDGAAGDMEIFATETGRDLGFLNEHLALFLDLSARIFLVQQDFNPDPDQIQQQKDALTGLLGVLNETQASFAGMRQVVGNLPRVTTRFNGARTRVLSVLQNAETEWAKVIHAGRSISNALAEEN